MTTRQELVKIKRIALRTRVWFKATSRIERAIINLTINCVETIKSPTLENVLLIIICKMTAALENRFLPKVTKIGRQLAKNIGNIAQKWGNKNASNWKHDPNFVIYLGVNSFN